VKRRGSCSTPPRTTQTPFAVTAQDAPGKLTVVANWVPLENPAGGPYFGKLDPS
jgi:hypothetical protein